MFVTQLKAFFAVARLGSVTQAARQLGLSQPTVTAQIKALEAHYGVELFRRQGGRLSLSDEGIRLLPAVDLQLQQEINVELAMRQAGEGVRGHLRLGATSPFYVLALMRQFGAAYPLVDVSISTGNSLQMVDALLEFKVDLATSSHLEQDQRLHRQLLGKDPLVLLLPRDHALATQRAVSLQALRGLDLIMRERGSITRRVTEQAFGEHGVAPRRVLEIASREAIREAVMAGMGVSVFARHETGTHPDLVALHFIETLPMIEEYLYCLCERRGSRLIDAFLGMLGSDASI
ncbi:MAG: LysR family transcriptional regulator [Burkholderiaceae bacterium]|nr:LysR family transcriptional regulator [Roseateles sp.]MBV8470080.1 LysR family transcriptional regulator [Burkholderiaceae bacterium]